MTKVPERMESFVFPVYNRADAKEVELLFQARRIPYGLKTDRGVWYFFIPGHSANIAKNELLLFRKEIIREPVYRDFQYDGPISIFPHTLIVTLLSIFHFYVSRSPTRLQWIKKGSSSAADVMKGELGKTVTALTLHGDDEHLVGNVLFLWFSGYAVENWLGYGTGWLFILFSGAGGNLLNAFFHQTSHNSIGASTAIFGAIGIVAGLRIRANFKKAEKLTFREKYLPVLTLVALFSLMGLDAESDIMAHFFGSVFGFLLGYLSAPISKGHLVENKKLQLISLAVFFFIIFIAWQ